MLARTAVAVCLALCLLGADWPKWPTRRGDGGDLNRYTSTLIEVDHWGPEPEGPLKLDVPRFASALRRVCANLSAARAQQLAVWIHEAAEANDEDPFLIAGLISRASRCLGEKSDDQEGIGLAGIQPDMYRSNIDVDMLQYAVPQGDDWEVRAKMLSKPFTPRNLENAQANIEWTAALLSMWREQHRAIDHQFEQTPHRSYVSHFLWGDRVQSTRGENGVLTDRRRLLGHYGYDVPAATRLFRGVEWGAPLEGEPRVISSKPGADRDRGLRMHRGVDVDAAMHEPVLAMADGVVSFAGVDLPGRGTAVELTPDEITQIPTRDMGAGGRYVCITHRPSPTRQHSGSAFAPDPPVTAVPRALSADGAQEEIDDEDGAPELAASSAQSDPAVAGKRARIELAPLEIFGFNPESLTVSCYMHLEVTYVAKGQEVKRGERVGTVGRTGCKESREHLHLEMKSEHELYDARDVLTGVLIGDPPWKSSDEERRARKRARAEGLSSSAMKE
ncbi:MAG TPA: M23 family metallopeptidase [Polyangiales bacterium]|nr:M23 family metallopeptidase [Polyangiales bacterium]